jgi:cardiolipin synthase (CMP-forming)
VIFLPNLFSFARLFAVPVAVWLMLDGQLNWAFWLFVAAGITDAIDGFIAKRFNAQTALGAYLDPIADKALLVSAYVTLGYLGNIPVWLVILVTFRDIMIIGGAILELTMTQSFKSEPTIISKINTGFQIALAAFVLAQYGLGFTLDRYFFQFLIICVAATTVLSGAGYLVIWGRRIAHYEGTH